MGNSSVKVDIISTLPPELVLIIISHLILSDVTSCLLVCRKWYTVIANLGPYWQNIASNILGLHSDVVLKYAPFYATRRDFYMAANRHRTTVKSSKLSCETIPLDQRTLEGEVYTHCLYTSGNMVVRTQRIYGEGNVLLLERLQNSSLLSHGDAPCNLEPVHSFLLHPISKLAWAYTNGKYLFWVTRSGLWHGYDLKEDLKVFCWKKRLLREGHGVTTTCCNECFLVVSAYWTPATYHHYLHSADSDAWRQG